MSVGYDTVKPLISLLPLVGRNITFRCCQMCWLLALWHLSHNLVNNYRVKRSVLKEHRPDCRRYLTKGSYNSPGTRKQTIGLLSLHFFAASIDNRSLYDCSCCIEAQTWAHMVSRVPTCATSTVVSTNHIIIVIIVVVVVILFDEKLCTCSKILNFPTEASICHGEWV